MQEFAKPLISEGAIDVAGKALTCLVCGHGEFVGREVSMNTSGLTALGLDWLIKSAVGVICKACGYVHLFMGRAFEWRGKD